MRTLHLACGSSPEYVPHIATMLASVAEHRGGLELDAHFVHGPAVERQTRRALVEMVERDGGRLTLHELDDGRIAGLPEMQEIPSTMWYRTFLPELLGDVSRVLYLDADTVAVDSLEPLWATELGGAYVGAVTNVWEPWHRPYTATLGIDDPDNYFNSGVLLMDLDAMRRDDCTRQILDCVGRFERLRWGDQDALNVVLGPTRHHLAPRWNTMNSVVSFPEAIDVFGEVLVREARERPGIRHFEGPWQNKPWHYMCPWEGRRDYLHYRRQTPWPEVEYVGATLRNRLRRWRRERGRARAA